MRQGTKLGLDALENFANAWWKQVMNNDPDTQLFRRQGKKLVKSTFKPRYERMSYSAYQKLKSST